MGTILWSGMGLWVILVACVSQSTHNSLDNIILGENLGQSPGQVNFPHRAHMDLGITCGICHHDYAGHHEPPPGPCGACHGEHDHNDSKVPDL